MDFKEYRQKAYEYQKNEYIMEKNIGILKEQGYKIKHWGEDDGTLEIDKTMSTQEMKVIEDEFNVHFALGGYKFVKFDFNKSIDGEYNPLMKEIRIAQKNTSDLYHNYFAKQILQSVYQNTTICGKNRRIELTRQFWGFFIKTINTLSLDEIIEIEKETDSSFRNYNVTSGYQFNFNMESD